MSFLKKCVMKSCSLNALMYGTEYIIYLFSLFLTPLCQGSGYPDAKALLQNNWTKIKIVEHLGNSSVVMSRKFVTEDLA